MILVINHYITKYSLIPKLSKYLYNYKNVYTPIEVDLNNNFNIQDYQNKLDTYKYTFIKDNEEYHFDSISS